jgi:hypothetical protein
MQMIARKDSNVRPRHFSFLIEDIGTRGSFRQIDMRCVNTCHASADVLFYKNWLALLPNLGLDHKKRMGVLCVWSLGGLKSGGRPVCIR